MSLFEFILVMVSLILAIGVTQLLQGVAALAHHPEERDFDWVPLAWASYLFLLSAAHWWSLWGMRAADWTFPAFFFVLLPPTLLYLAVSLLVSGGLSATGTAMSEDFLGIRVPFFIVLLVFNVLVMWDGALLGVEPAWNSLRALQLVGTVLLLTGLVSRRWGIQKLVAVLTCGFLVVASFVLRFLPGAFESF